jgi:regulator of cell morphogenesis and NO signaling
MIKIRFLGAASWYFAPETKPDMIKSYDAGIDENACAADIVKKQYKTAAIFKQHGIEYCCGGKWPLKMVCETKGLNTNELLNQLHEASRNISVAPSLSFANWNIDFLTDYIVNIHHEYLRQALPAVATQLNKFVQEHSRKFPHLAEVETHFDKLHTTMIPHLLQEEEIIFPYIKQIAHAYESRESYASLLVRTLRKPIEDIMHHEHTLLEKILYHFRTLTNSYTPPEACCTSHRLSFSLLRELDDDLVQHMYLENEILFPRAVSMEKELLQRK